MERSLCRKPRLRRATRFTGRDRFWSHSERLGSALLMRGARAGTANGRRQAKSCPARGGEKRPAAAARTVTACQPTAKLSRPDPSSNRRSAIRARCASAPSWRWPAQPATDRRDITAQTRDALRRIEIALQQAGAALSDVVRTRIYVTDIAHWREVGAVHAEVFGAIRPVATMVEVSGADRPVLHVEIEADAYVDRGLESAGGNVRRGPAEYAVTLITARTGSGPYRCGNSIDSGSVVTPGSQRTGESSSAGSMCNRTGRRGPGRAGWPADALAPASTSG